jgi:hypothetical protein
VGDASGIDHVAEEAEVDEVELHGAYRGWNGMKPNGMEPTANGRG